MHNLCSWQQERQDFIKLLETYEGTQMDQTANPILVPGLIRHNATLTHDYTPSHDRGLAAKAGDAVTVLRTEPEWVRIRNSSGQEGWVPQAFLKLLDENGV